MTQGELKTLLETLQVQVFYNHTTKKDVVNLPYIVFLDDNNNSFFADNITWAETVPYTIILHTHDRDYELEKSIKKLFTDNNIAYVLNDISWLEDLLMWQVSFEITVYGT